MKKILTLLLSLFILLLVALFGVIFSYFFFGDGVDLSRFSLERPKGEVRTTSAETDYPTDETLISDEIIETVDELDEKVAYMSDNFITTAKLLIRDIKVWEELNNFYLENAGILAMRGIQGIGISYVQRSGYIVADITSKYEMYMNVLIAWENNDTEPLGSEEMKVYTKAGEIIGDTVSSSDTKFAQSLAIHEYLVDLIEYEHDYENNSNAFNVYGALIEGKAVCQGYAHAYQMLLHMAGIESMIITGEAGDENHAWNLVNYGSSSNPEWYHVDVTWNDQEDFKTLRFFNVNDSVMSYTHDWNRITACGKMVYPNADSVKYNYFRWTDMMAPSLIVLEEKFAENYKESDFFEILCTFDLITDDLVFLGNYVDAEEVMFSIKDYGDAQLLTILL